MPQPLSLLLRKKKVQDIYSKYTPLGIPNTHIYKKHILPEFGISKRTFYSYIGSRSAEKDIQQYYPTQAKHIFNIC